MAAQRIHPASQPGVLNALAALNRSQTSPYRFARELGLSPNEARSRPATSALLAAHEFLGFYQPAASAIATGP